MFGFIGSTNSYTAFLGILVDFCDVVRSKHDTEARQHHSNFPHCYAMAESARMFI